MLLVPTRLRESSIHGLGVFADAFIPKGTLMWRFVPGLDQVINPNVLTTLPAHVREEVESYAYDCRFQGGLVLGGDHSRYINHSAAPNVDNSGPESYALRDIYAGEEITCDYVELCEAYESLPYVMAVAA